MPNPDVKDFEAKLREAAAMRQRAEKMEQEALRARLTAAGGQRPVETVRQPREQKTVILTGDSVGAAPSGFEAPAARASAAVEPFPAATMTVEPSAVAAVPRVSAPAAAPTAPGPIEPTVRGVPITGTGRIYSLVEPALRPINNMGRR